MKKYIFPLLVGLLTSLSFSTTASAESRSDKQVGLNLDIARRFYSVDLIKGYIDLLSENGADFLHLHFADDHNYAIESKILHQTVENAEMINGVYYNTAPSDFNPDKFEPRPFLSFEQVEELAEYAKGKGIELIPELDSPGHMWGIRDLFTFNGMDESIFDGNELIMSMPESREFMKRLWTEVMEVFPYSKRVHLGGDEFTHTEEVLLVFASYTNELTDFLTDELNIEHTMIWNDAIRNVNVGDFNSSIQVTYWTYSDFDSGEVLEDDRLTFPDLLKRGFEVYNYNGYYLYFVPSDSSLTQEAIDYRENDMRENWHLGKWDLNNSREITKIPSNLLGSVISIWGEDSASHTPEEIYAASKTQIVDMINMVSSVKLRWTKYLPPWH